MSGNAKQQTSFFLKELSKKRSDLFGQNIYDTKTYSDISCGKYKNDTEKELDNLCRELDILISKYENGYIADDERSLSDFRKMCTDKYYNIVELVKNIKWE